MDKKTVTFTVQMDEDQAYQLAQFLKRVGFSEIRQHASDDAEAYIMKDGLDQVRLALQRSGYDPR
jgi:4-hydroxyphenylpyruvate dioxygenase-like putative hemolysin